MRSSRSSKSRPISLPRVGADASKQRRQAPRYPAVGERRRQVDLRHHAPLELRRRAAVRARADLDSLPAHPRRARDARGGGGRGASAPSSRRRSRRPTAGATGRRRRARSATSCRKGALGAVLRLRQRRAAAAPARAARTARARRRARRSSARSCPASSARASTPSATSSTCSTRSHEISAEAVDPTHVFTLSQVYEGLLLKMGEKGNDGGQFFTPREIIRAMVRVDRPAGRRDGLRPRLRHRRLPGPVLRVHAARATGQRSPPPTSSRRCKQRTFYGREKDNLIYPIALANLVLHGIDEPHIWHGNTLTGSETYGGLFAGRAARSSTSS